MTKTTRLSLPLIAEAQAQKHVTHNEALLDLDVLVQTAVKDRDLTAPPDAPSEGEAWIVAAGATGDWAGHDGEVAAWQGGVWRFHAPRAGWVAWVEDEQLMVFHDGSGWGRITGVDAVSLGGHPASDYVLTGDLASASVGDADTVDGHHAEEFALLSGATFTGGVTLPMLGVQTSADTTNRMAVKSDAVLFSHDDASGDGSGDVRVILNKAAEGRTASFLFQDNWSGRAEFGLTGNDDFSLKVSADGATWREALHVICRTDTQPVIHAFGPMRMASYMVSTLPDAADAGAGAVIFVSDESGGATLAFSDGANWRRIQDRAIVT